MTDEVNEEEAWLYKVVDDFNYVVCSAKYGPLFYDLLTDQAKLTLSNMYNLEKQGLTIKCLSH
jgi:hypothetical protein